MNSRKAGIIPLIIGLIGLLEVTRHPRFEMFHTVDVVQLVASGMCFGVALVALLGRLVPRRK